MVRVAGPGTEPSVLAHAATDLTGPGGARLRCALTPWDAETFGHELAVILELDGPPTAVAGLLEEYERWRRERDVTFTSVRLAASAAGHIAALQAHGFRFVELVLHPALELDPAAASAPPDPAVRPASPGDLPAIRSIAARSFSLQRFHLDPGFPKERADARYAAWVERSWSDPGDAFLVAAPAGQIAGFWLYRIAGERAELALTAIAPEHQGRGVGRLLWSEGVRHLARAGARRVRTTINAANLRVVNLYARLGWSFYDPEVTLHCWHDLSGAS